MPSEVVLSTIAGSTEGDRLLLVLLNTAEGSHVELRQQSYGEGIGWFNQATIRLEASQVAELRNALGTGGVNRSAAQLPKNFRRAQSQAWQPRVIHADSA
jgi:hypothetical protein